MAMGIIGILSRDFRIPLPPFSVISKINPSFFFDKGVLDSPVPLLRRVFSQPPRPSFIRRAPHPSPSLCPSQKGEDVTAPPVALNRFALRLTDHQRSRQGVLAGMNPQGEDLLKDWLCGMGPQGKGGRGLLCNSYDEAYLASLIFDN